MVQRTHKSGLITLLVMAVLIAVPSLWQELTPDGLYYWYASRTLRDTGEMLNDPNIPQEIQVISGQGRYYATFAPLLPILITPFGNFHEAAFVVNACASLLLAGFCYAVSRQRATVAILLFVATFPTWGWFTYLLSDGLFMGVSAWALWIATRPLSRQNAILLALCVVALSTLRYAGLLALPLFGIWAIRQWRIWWLVVLSAIPVGVWIVRNLAYTGHITGHTASGVSLPVAIGQYSKGIQWTFTGIILIGALLSLRYLWRRRIARLSSTAQQARDYPH